MKKPTYLGLLNAIAVGEGEGAEYLAAWADVTDDKDVHRALRTVIARETEHAAAFAKRLDELGYDVLPRPNPDHAKRIKFARSSKSDFEKLEKFGFGRDPSSPDIFDRMFNNHDIDITTGALLGRYIAEERDTVRLLHGLHRKLREAGGGRLIDQALADAPSRDDLIVDGDGRWSSSALEARVAAVAGGLRAAGVGEGDAVCWQRPNGVDAVVLYRACWRIGAVAAPMHHLAGTADVERITATVQPRLTIVDALPDGPPIAPRVDHRRRRGDLVHVGFERRTEGGRPHAVRGWRTRRG